MSMFTYDESRTHLVDCCRDLVLLAPPMTDRNSAAYKTPLQRRTLFNDKQKNNLQLMIKKQNDIGRLTHIISYYIVFRPTGLAALASWHSFRVSEWLKLYHHPRICAYEDAVT